MTLIHRLTFITCLCLGHLSVSNASSSCSYDSYQWSTVEKRSVNHQHISHPYNQLQPEERDSLTGCTVCQEDQVKISLPGIKPFRVCKVIAPKIIRALGDLIQSGETIT